MNSTYLTPKELSDRYKGRVAESTLANWRSTKKGPAFRKIGGRVLYDLEDVKSWEASRKNEGRSPA